MTREDLRRKDMSFGWNDNGEYHCPCGTMIGKNLLGEMPFACVARHRQLCVVNAIALLKTGYPIGTCPPTYVQDTWDQAVKLHLKGK